jgi:hypothetical protein
MSIELTNTKKPIESLQKEGEGVNTESRTGYNIPFKSIEDAQRFVKREYTTDKIKERAINTEHPISTVGDDRHRAAQLVAVIASIPANTIKKRAWAKLLIAKIRLAEKGIDDSDTGKNKNVATMLLSKVLGISMREVMDEEKRAMDWVQNCLAMRNMGKIDDLVRERYAS